MKEGFNMKIAIGCDHAAFEMKHAVMKHLEEKGIEYKDFGTYTPDSSDYPLVARDTARAVASGEFDRGIVLCGTGIGASIACNKVPGIRASVCHDLYTAHQCVEHDDVQIIAMGAQIIGPTVAEELIDLFLQAEFSTSPEFRRRVEKLAVMDGSKAR